MKHPLIDASYRPDAVVLADGCFPVHPTPLAVLRAARYVCCCDGAAKQLLSHGREPDAIVGDGDSLPPELRRQYGHILHIVDEQQDNDLTKATRHCMAQGFSRIAYLGATGKREDHTLGNISLMARYMADMQLQVAMLTDYGYFVPAKGYAEMESFAGQQVSIFNLSCEHISAEGLKWEPYAYRHLWQGTLNEATTDRFRVHGDGVFMIFRTYERK